MDPEIKKEFEDLTGVVKKTFDSVDKRFDEIEKKMVTKEEFTQGLNRQKLEILDAMDDKLSDLRGDLVILMRKEDQKVVRLIEILKNKNILEEVEVKELLEMQPFSKISINPVRSRARDKVASPEDRGAATSNGVNPR